MKKRYCSRCGKEIKFLGFTSFLLIPKRFLLRSIFNGNADCHADLRFELCAECTKSFEAWLWSKREKKRSFLNAILKGLWRGLWIGLVLWFWIWFW